MYQGLAQQLVRSGQQVGILALFDTFGPDYPQQQPDQSSIRFRFLALKERVSLHLGNLLVAKGPGEKVAYVKTKSLIVLRKIVGANRRRLNRLVKALGLPRTLREVELAIGKAKNRYVYDVYPRRVTLFRAVKQPAGYGYDRNLGWTRVAVGGIEVHDVPGHHGAIVHEPRVSILAEQLADCLARFERAAPAVDSPERSGSRDLVAAG